MQIFLDPEAIKIKQNQLLQTLESWGPTFSISVEIKITSFQKQEAGRGDPPADQQTRGLLS